MNWRKISACCMMALAIGAASMASDLSEAARTALPPMFAFHDLPGENTLYFQNEQIPYEAAQLTADMKQDKVFLSGYIFYATIPDRNKALIDPYFRYNATTAEFVGMASLNAALFNPDSPLHRSIEESVSRWADQMVGGSSGAHLVVTLSEMEPVRRTDGANCILYTTGSEITLSSEGLILPLYGKGYVYRDGSQYRLVMLITSDDSKRVLSYALDDMVRVAAELAAKRDLKNYVASLKKNQK